MKRKTLMTMAVAGTFGLSAAAFAGSGHEVITPFSVSESGQNIVSHEKGFSESYHQSSLGSTSSEAGGWVSGSNDSSMLSSESTASLGSSDSYALADEGIYSDFYIVSFEPVALESWDVYVINTGDMNELAAADEFEIGVPTHELALISNGDSMELVLVPTAEVSGEMLGD